MELALHLVEAPDGVAVDSGALVDVVQAQVLLQHAPEHLVVDVEDENPRRLTFKTSSDEFSLCPTRICLLLCPNLASPDLSLLLQVVPGPVLDVVGLVEVVLGVVSIESCWSWSESSSAQSFLLCLCLLLFLLLLSLSFRRRRLVMRVVLVCLVRPSPDLDLGS